jgi:hypothetical protein
LQLGIALPEAGARTLVPIPPDKQPYPNIKTVAVVSNIGHSLDYERFATILGRSSKLVPVPDWRLDAFVEAGARAALASRFEIRNVSIDRTAFAQASLIDANDKLDPQFPGLSPTSTVDAYLVFVKLREPLDEITMSGTGLGMSHNAVLPKTSLFAHYAVALVDAHTLKVISATPAIASPNLPSSKPSFDVDDSLWPADPAAPTASQASDIQKYLHTLVAETCRESMLRLGLTGMMPDGAAPPAPVASLSN